MADRSRPSALTAISTPLVVVGLLAAAFAGLGSTLADDRPTEPQPTGPPTQQRHPSDALPARAERSDEHAPAAELRGAGDPALTPDMEQSRTLASADALPGTGLDAARKAAVSGGPSPLQTPGDRDQHPPIRVVGDEGPLGFVLADSPDGDPVYRPGSGVVDGQGTAEDPYVIAGWNVSYVNLDDTRAHVVLRDLTVRDHVDLDDAENVTITGVDLPYDWSSARIDILNAENVTVTGNDVRVAGTGIDVRSSHQVTIAANHVVADGYTSFGVVASGGSEHVTVADNGFPAVSTNDWRGGAVQFHEVQNVTAAGNAVHGGAGGIAHFGVTNATAENNTLVGQTVAALYFDYSFFGGYTSDRVHLANNTALPDGGVGVHNWYSPENATYVGNALGSGGFFANPGRSLGPGNTVNAEPVRSLRGLDNVTVTEPVGQLFLWQGENVTVEGLEVGPVRWRAVQAWDVDDLTVRNTTVHAASLAAGDGDGIRLVDNRVEGAGGYLGTSSGANVSVVGNVLDDVSGDIWIFDAPEPRVESNRVATTGGEAVDVYSREGDRSTPEIVDNGLSGGGLDLSWYWWVDISAMYDFANATFAENTVGGEPLVVAHEAQDETIDRAGQVILAGGANVSLTGLDLANVARPVQVAGTENATLEDVTIEETRLGVEASSTGNVTIQGLTVEDSRGGVLARAVNVTVEDSRFDDVGEALRGYANDTVAVRDTVVADGPPPSWEDDIFLEPIAIDGWASTIEVEDVTVRNQTRRGLYLVGDNVTVASSLVTQVGGGYQPTPVEIYADRVTLSGSNIYDNEGSSWILQDPPAADAHGIWWGCPTGPNTPGCDDVVTAHNTVPWSPSPHPGAGAE